VAKERRQIWSQVDRREGGESSHLLASKQNVVALLVGTTGESPEDELFPRPKLLRIRLNDLLSCERNDLLESDGEDVGSGRKKGRNQRKKSTEN